jgi:polyhydroxybutyrate depolymerase
MAKLTKRGLEERGDRDGWIVVYPDGLGKQWSDGRHDVNRPKDADDIGFLSAMIDALVAKENVDKKRVFATGISNGGFMSHRLGRELSSKIAAIAPVAANLQEEADLASVPSRAVSVLAINGTEDPIVPWEGGFVHIGKQKRGKCRSVKDTIAWWAKVNGCAAEATISQEPDRDPEDGTCVRKEVHGGGKDGAEVILYAVEGGGHTWPSGSPYLPQMIVGRVSKDVDANDLVWEFFKRHPMP